MKILPVEYGIAGYLSVVARGPDDGAAEYNRALTDAATQTLVRERLRQTRERDELLSGVLVRENQRLRVQNSELADALYRHSPAALDESAPGASADLQDIATLRRENKGLRESLDWHVRRLEELSRQTA